MPTIVGVIVASLLLAWLLIAMATALRLSAAKRRRPHARADEDIPDGFVALPTEPAGLRAPFALLAVGEVVDIPSAYEGRWQGREAAIADVLIRLERRTEPVTFTVVVLEVEQRFPWTRLRQQGIAVPPVDDRLVDLADLSTRATTATNWILEGADPTFVAELVGDDLLTWLSSHRLPLQVELVPRHLMVAVTGRVPSDDLAQLLGIATELSAHVPTSTWQSRLPPPPEQEWEDA